MARRLPCGRQGCRPVAAAVLTSQARRSARLCALRAWPLAPSVASRLNTAFGEDEINESDTRTAGFDAMSVSGDAGLASGESDSLAALAGGPARGGSAPRDEPVRTLTIVGVALRISPRRDEKIPCNKRDAGMSRDAGMRIHKQTLLSESNHIPNRAASREVQVLYKPFPPAIPGNRPFRFPTMQAVD